MDLLAAYETDIYVVLTGPEQNLPFLLVFQESSYEHFHSIASQTLGVVHQKEKT